MSGYIKLWRGWRDTDGLTPSTVYSECEAWLWLLENCAWKETVRRNGKGEEIRLQPGEIHVSVRSLAVAWGWSKSKVSRFLERLKSVKKVGQQQGQSAGHPTGQMAGQSGTVLAIVNWEKYQEQRSEAGQSAGQQQGRSAKRNRDTHKEEKEGKKNNITRICASRPADVGDQVWADFEALRKTKRAPLTETAVTAIRDEAAKAGLTLEAALTECVARGWQGFKAEWVRAAQSEAEKYGQVW